MKQPKTDFVRRLDDLELDIHNELKRLVGISKKYSESTVTQIIPVDIYGYTELAVIDDELIFLDRNGLHYSINNSDVSLHDLIDIIEDNQIEYFHASDIENIYNNLHLDKKLSTLEFAINIMEEENVSAYSKIDCVAFALGYEKDGELYHK